MTQRSGPRPLSDGSAIRPGTPLGQLFWRCSFLPAFPSSGSVAAAHSHWSGWLSISPLHTSPKQPVKQARVREAELVPGGGASSVEGTATASRLWLRTERGGIPRCSCSRCCTQSGKRVFLAGRLPHLFFPARGCLLGLSGFEVLVRAVKPPTVASPPVGSSCPVARLLGAGKCVDVPLESPQHPSLQNSWNSCR